MSFVSTIFNRSNIKLFVALAIPVGIIWLFVYSQQQAVVEEQKYREEQRIHPNAETVAVNNYSLKEVDDANHLRWQLLAKRGVVGTSGRTVVLQEVSVSYFDQGKLKMHLFAPTGDADEETRYVKLTSAEGKRVTAEGEDGKAKLEAQTVELMKKNQFKATGGVIIEWPEVAKVTGDRASGIIDAANLKNLKLAGNTHAVISVH